MTPGVGAGDSQVKWDVMKRKEVPKKVKPTPRAPLVLIWDTMRVVTMELSTSAGGSGADRPPQPEGPATRGVCPRMGEGSGLAAGRALPEQNQMRSLRMSTDRYSAPWAAECSIT